MYVNVCHTMVPIRKPAHVLNYSNSLLHYEMRTIRAGTQKRVFQSLKKLVFVKVAGIDKSCSCVRAF